MNELLAALSCVHSRDAFAESEADKKRKEKKKAAHVTKQKPDISTTRCFLPAAELQHESSRLEKAQALSENKQQQQQQQKKGLGLLRWQC